MLIFSILESTNIQSLVNLVLLTEQNRNVINVEIISVKKKTFRRWKVEETNSNLVLLQEIEQTCKFNF